MIVNAPLLSHRMPTCLFKHEVAGISQLPTGNPCLHQQSHGDLLVEQEGKGDCDLLYWELCLDKN